MNNIINRPLIWVAILPFIVSITGWFQGWEITYRPIPNAPIISPYTSFIFIILFFNKINLKEYHQRTTSLNKVKAFSLGIISSLLFLELLIHTDGGSQFLGFPISSVSTIFSFLLICVVEVICSETKSKNLLVDTLLLLTFFWVYLSICGHLFSENILTGIHINTDIGLSLLTAIAFLAYLVLLFKDDKNSYIKNLCLTVSWAKKYICLYFLGFLILPFIFVMLLKNVTIRPEDYFKIFILFSTIGLFFISIFITLIHFLSKTHAGLQVLCKDTKKVQMPDGSWMPIEKYLRSNYGLDLKYITTNEKSSPGDKFLKKG